MLPETCLVLSKNLQDGFHKLVSLTEVNLKIRKKLKSFIKNLKDLNDSLEKINPILKLF